MNTPSPTHIRELIERIARIYASDEWTNELNPTQHAALSYLSRANRFSRAPSHVADFLSTTRGTVSQTLKALARKDLAEEVRSKTDGRSISYKPTKKGIRILSNSKALEDALEKLSGPMRSSLSQGLEELIRTTLKAKNNKQFGLCNDCQHHQERKMGGYCNLLNEVLENHEKDQICHEFEEFA